jgi:hypothetical protein
LMERRYRHGHESLGRTTNYLETSREFEFP